MRARPALPRLAVAAASVALALGGCGSGESASGDADPAAYVPADASVYLEGVVRPEGDQREQLAALASKLLRTDDPSQRLQELLDEAIAHGPADRSYQEDVEPWLGRRAGIYLTGFEGEEPQFIVAVATRDPDKAQQLVADDDDVERRGSYEGADYAVDAEGEVAGVVDEALVVASDEAQFKRAVDAARGQSLADAERFDQAVDGLPGDRVATLFVDLRRFLDAAIASSEDLQGPAGAIARSLLGGGMPPVAAALLADADTVAVETRMEKVSDGSLLGVLSTYSLVGATELVEQLPGDAWLAAGSPELGRRTQQVVEQLGGAIGGAVLQGQLEAQTGLDFERDVFAWIGDAAVFAREGDGAPAVGVVIQATDEALARRAIPRLVGALRRQGVVALEPTRVPGADMAFAATLPGAPAPLVVALAGDRVVVALGEQTAREALDPAERLGDTDRFEQARELVDGLAPSLIVDGPQAVELLAAGAGGDPDFAQARPYLEMIGLIAAGGGDDGDEARQRLAVEVR